jgi:hypothetical protein
MPINGHWCQDRATARSGVEGGHRATAGLLRGNLIEYFELAPQRDKLSSIGRRAEYSLDDLVSICIKAAAMAEHNSLWLP